MTTIDEVANGDSEIRLIKCTDGLLRAQEATFSPEERSLEDLWSQYPTIEFSYVIVRDATVSMIIEFAKDPAAQEVLEMIREKEWNEQRFYLYPQLLALRVAEELDFFSFDGYLSEERNWLRDMEVVLQEVKWMCSHRTVYGERPRFLVSSS